MSIDLRPRDHAVLRVLAEHPRDARMGLSAGRVGHLVCADEPYRGRRDAGMTRTLDRLQNLGLVRGHYERGGTGRYWTITDAGRKRVPLFQPRPGPNVENIRSSTQSKKDVTPVPKKGKKGR